MMFQQVLPPASEWPQFMPVINMKFQNTVNKNQDVAIHDIIKIII